MFLFAGYHLKYFYSRAQYRNSCYHVDNIIMQMFTRVVSTLTQLCSGSLQTAIHLLHCLNSLNELYFRTIWTKQSIFMLICWLSKQKTHYPVGSLAYLRRLSDQKKTLIAAATWYKGMGMLNGGRNGLAFPAGHNRVLKGRTAQLASRLS